MNRILQCCSQPSTLLLFAASLSVLVGLFTPGSAYAMGMTTLPALAQSSGDDSIGSGPITVWYPSKGAETTRAMGPFALSAAWDSAPARGNGALVVFSHGSGGSTLPYHDLARVLVEAGFVVAAPEHNGDNWQDQSKVGPTSWKQRPAEASRTIDRVQAEPRFAPLLEKSRVGIYGMSAGGLTALEFAGATWSLSRLVKHCTDHFDEDVGFCAYREMTKSAAGLDAASTQGAKAQYMERIESRPIDTKEYGHQDNRVKAVVAAVPAAAAVDPASLDSPRVPTALIAAEKDQVLAPRWHVLAIENACKSCAVLGPLRGGGHLSILSPMPESVAASMGSWAKDPPGFDRASLAPLYKDIAQFFLKHL